MGGIWNYRNAIGFNNAPSDPQVSLAMEKALEFPSLKKEVALPMISLSINSLLAVGSHHTNVVGS